MRVFPFSMVTSLSVTVPPAAGAPARSAVGDGSLSQPIGPARTTTARPHILSTFVLVIVDSFGAHAPTMHYGRAPDWVGCAREIPGPPDRVAAGCRKKFNRRRVLGEL